MKQILIQDKNQAIAIDSMNVAKNIFRPFLVANYVDYDEDFKPVGGGQKAHEKYINWYKTYLPIAQQAFTEAVKEMQKAFGSTEKSVIYHAKFDTIMNAIRDNKSPYLVGPAGTGKSFTCEQIAKKLGLDFYSQNAVSDASDLTGYTDAVGNYVEKAFYKAFKNGGLFLFDEIDSSVPEALMCINNAIANGVMLFPNGEQVRQHKDFHIILAGNTFGTGATNEYNTRCQLDAAFRDRIFFVRYNYDKKVEESIANNNKDVLDFYYAYRKTLKKLGIKQIVSYRGLDTLANCNTLQLEDIIEGAFTKELGADTIYQIYTNIGINNKYVEALYNTYKNVKEEEENW